ncbi:putative DNA-binding transcriptional regulator YafY [Actinoplanes tereljensis]|uniref:Transcriptional regulator n=1 Tax=Paractinoplanes tereljensis TaxID=571912 RepID=A0A919NMU0_9ACTN|nr:YafY family protein [Actinoplanes tereljensis]GIF21015.1 transcriptional regulator [Actinoplanes tereljensis]
MNRTDRLYALVEELRAISPRPRSARWLAERFEVSVRTVERDISALQQSGTPVYAEPGRTGGYCLDKQHTLPPVNFTPSEAVAMAVGLHGLTGSPFHGAAAAALRKLVAAMHADDVARARLLAGRVRLVAQPPAAEMPRLLADALSIRRVLRIRYADKTGVGSEREIEPLAFVGMPTYWYLVAWCRLRRSVRVFRTDRIASVVVTAEEAPQRDLMDDLRVPGEASALSLV